jgi:hypothetical protein
MYSLAEPVPLFGGQRTKQVPARVRSSRVPVCNTLGGEVQRLKSPSASHAWLYFGFQAVPALMYQPVFSEKTQGESVLSPFV